MSKLNISTFAAQLDWDGDYDNGGRVLLYFGGNYVTEWPVDAEEAGRLAGNYERASLDEFVGEKFGELFALLAKSKEVPA